MTAPCTHGYTSPASCVDCMDEGNLPAPPQPPTTERDGPVIAARYDGQCQLCNTGIHSGQPIVRTTLGTYAHARCLP